MISRFTKCVSVVLLAVCAAALVSSCGGGGGGGGGQSSAIAYAYVPAGKSIGEYGVQSNGTLQTIPSAPQPSSANNEAIVISPNSKFAYVLNPSLQTISQYFIGSNGALSPLNPKSVTANPEAVAFVVSPSLPFGYEVISNGASAGTIVMRAVNTNGTLAPASNAVHVVIGSSPVDSEFSPSGSNFYVTDRGGDVFQFQVSSSGGLTPLAPSTVITGSSTGDTADYIAFSPNGQYAYVSDTGDNSIVEYPVVSGALEQAQATHIAAGIQPHGVVVDHSGRYVYAAATQLSDLTATPSVMEYSITSNGSPAYLGTELYKSPVSPKVVRIDPTGSFLYAVADSGIASFSIGSDGSLTQASGSTPSGTGDIAFAAKQ